MVYKMLIIFMMLMFLIFNSEGYSLRNEEASPTRCHTRGGRVGECVPSHLCDRHSNTIITDGMGILNTRISRLKRPSGVERIPSRRTAATALPRSRRCTNHQEYKRHDDCPLPMVCCQVAKYNTLHRNPKYYTPICQQYVRMARDLKRQGCGWSNENGVDVNAIINNVSEKHAKPGEFPWAVSIMRLRSIQGQMVHFDYLGGGSLIHESSVLTSAHLFHKDKDVNEKNDLYVVVGDFDQERTNIIPRKSIKVRKVDIHHEYNDDNLINDFALVFLVKSVTVASHVNFICLPPKSVEVTPGTKCISSGWGKDGQNVHQYIINKVELPVVDRETCRNQLRSFPNMGPFFELHDSLMCARSEKGEDSCKGSGGSSLACPIQGQPGRYTLNGIVTWTSNCSFDGLPSMYANVANVRQWIDDKMKENGYPINSYTDY